MRLIPRHGEVGYVAPQNRAACRNCTHLSAGEENGLGLVPYQTCRKHSFEIRAGGLCDDYERDRLVSLGPPVRIYFAVDAVETNPPRFRDRDTRTLPLPEMGIAA